MSEFDGELFHKLSNEHEKIEKYSSWNFLLFIMLVWCYILIASTFESKKITFIHVTGVGILLGLIVGLIFHLVTEGVYDYSNLRFNEKFFFYMVLPPIIFSAAYCLDVKKCMHNFSYIALYGFGTTLICFLIIAITTILFNLGEKITTKDGQQVDMKVSDQLLYSAAICSSDSVAALAIIDPVQSPKLFTIIFGEGILNDVVSIVFFLSVYDLFGNKDDNNGFEWYTIFQIMLNFLIILVASVTIGFIMGIISALMTKYLRLLIQNPIIELTTVLLSGYASFVICQQLDFSGILSMIVCGVFQNHYTSKNLSVTGKISVKIVMDFLSICSEGFIYIYIGISAWYYQGPFSDELKRPFSWGFIIYEILIVLGARALGIIIPSFLAQKCYKKKFKLNKWEMSIICLGGMVRGSIAYALIQILPGVNHGQKIIKSTIFFIVVFTTLAMGIIIPMWTKYALKKMEEEKIDQFLQDNSNNKSILDPLQSSAEKKSQREQENQVELKENSDEKENSKEIKISSSESQNSGRKISTVLRFEGWFERHDEAYFLPFFVHDYKNKSEILYMQQEALNQLTIRSVAADHDNDIITFIYKKSKELSEINNNNTENNSLSNPPSNPPSRKESQDDEIDKKSTSTPKKQSENKVELVQIPK